MKNQPFYEILTEKLRSQIKNGSYKYPNKLPSIRTMAEHIKMSKTTVIAAYEQLVAEGYLENREKSGFFVNKLDISNDFETIKTEIAIESPLTYKYHLGQSNISEKNFPHSSWRQCVNLALNDFRLQLIDDFGLHGLRQLIADYLYISRGVNASYQQVVIASGVQSLSVMLAAIFNKKIIAYENPGYSGIRSIFQNSGYEIKAVDVGSEGIDLKELEKIDFSSVFVSPSHQYPLGKILPVNKRYELIRIANQKSAFIIEDDYDSEFRYGGKPIPSLQSLDQSDSVIYMNTFSKSFMPSLRIAYMVLPKRLVEAARQTNIGNSCSSLMQQALYHFIAQGHWSKHIRRMRKIYSAKLVLLKKSLIDHFHDKIEIDSADTGIRLLISFKSKESEAYFFKSALDRGILLKRLNSSWYEDIQTKQKKLFMIGFGNIDNDEIEIICKDLAIAWLDKID